MIRILRHTLCLALLLTLAACEKDREPRIEVSTGEIHLPGDASSGTTFTVSAEEPWTLSYTGEGFAVTPDGGGYRVDTGVNLCGFLKIAVRGARGARSGAGWVCLMDSAILPSGAMEMTLTLTVWPASSTVARSCTNS